MLRVVSVYTVYTLVICSVVSFNPHVTSSTGNYRGQKVKTNGGVPYYVFRGIKYAHVVERFQEAVPVGDSNGMFEAYKFGPACYQNNTDEFKLKEMSEDCLYLNIYSPNLEGSLPVIVFIHGGSFFEGSCQEYDGKLFMDSRKVVAITISYRIGPFGFLYLGDDSYPSNLGIRDQILALKWIQKNVRNFGGDPKRITVNGQSAGGASIDILMHSPLAKGLFIGAISESGTSCSRFSLQPVCGGIQRRNLLALFTGCFLHIPFPGFSARNLVSCLQNKAPDEILNATQKFPVWMHATYFTPVVEPETSYNPVITRFPWLEDENSVDLVPWITGVNSNEAYELIEDTTLSHNLLVKMGMEVFLSFVLPDFLFYRFTARNTFITTESLQYNFLELLSSDFLQFVNQIANQGFFYYPMVRCLRPIRSPTYAYYFNYTGSDDNTGGVPHTRELIYSWDTIDRNITSQKDLAFSKKFIDTWIHFAYYQTANFSGVTWDKYNSSRDNVLIMNNDEIFMGTNPNHDNNTFWDTINIDTDPKTNFCFVY